MVSEDDVRTAALALPATNEKSSYGMPGFRVRTKGFARLHEQPGVLVLWCADVGEKEALIATEPEKFFTTPHYDGYSHVLVRLDRIESDELTDLLTRGLAVAGSPVTAGGLRRRREVASDHGLRTH